MTRRKVDKEETTVKEVEEGPPAVDYDGLVTLVMCVKESENLDSVAKELLSKVVQYVASQGDLRAKLLNLLLGYLYIPPAKRSALILSAN